MITRRGFLGASAAAAAAVGTTLLAKALVSTEPLWRDAPYKPFVPYTLLSAGDHQRYLRETLVMREATQYNITADELYLRHDVMFVDTDGVRHQMCVDTAPYYPRSHREEHVAPFRAPARQRLAELIERSGLLISTQERPPKYQLVHDMRWIGPDNKVLPS